MVVLILVLTIGLVQVLCYEKVKDAKASEHRTEDKQLTAKQQKYLQLVVFLGINANLCRLRINH